MSSVMELLLLYINATSAANLSQPPASITLGGKKRCIISLSKALLFFYTASPQGPATLCK